MRAIHLEQMPTHCPALKKNDNDTQFLRMGASKNSNNKTRRINVKKRYNISVFISHSFMYLWFCDSFFIGFILFFFYRFFLILFSVFLFGYVLSSKLHQAPVVCCVFCTERCSYWRCWWWPNDCLLISCCLVAVSLLNYGWCVCVCVVILWHIGVSLCVCDSIEHMHWMYEGERNEKKKHTIFVGICFVLFIFGLWLLWYAVAAATATFVPVDNIVWESSK